MVATTSTAPDRSIKQRMEALQRANEIRTKRAALKRDLKAGSVTIIDMILEPPAYVATARVFDLLLATPKYGRVKATKVLQLCRVSPSKTLGGLSPRQRTELASMLRGVWSSPHASARPLIIHPPVTAAVAIAPTEYERRVLALATNDFGAVSRTNAGRAAAALASNPSAVTRACDDLRRKGLLDAVGRPTHAGRTHASVLTNAA